MNKTEILLVEDEEVLAMIIKETLELRGFNINLAKNGVEGWAMYHQIRPDICVIDVMMPRKSGYDLVSDIRKVDEWTPIIFLTAKIQQSDVLKGLEIGADDYVKKPFSMEELILRIDRLCKRNHKHPSLTSVTNNSVIQIGDWIFDCKNMRLSNTAVFYTLSQREAELLQILSFNLNELVERRDILLKVWGDDSPFNARSMDVYITRLRKYFSSSVNVQILNIRGRGYKLVTYNF